MFISTAWAQAGGGGGGSDIFTAMLPLVLIFAVFYFLLIRPQQKKMKTHQQMIGNLQRGDKIVTGGGLHGTVTKVLNEVDVMVEIAEGVRVKVARGTITTLLTQRGATAAPANAAPANSGGVGGLLGKLMGKK
jgi:preprotein translocase subunit YajC